MDRVLLGFTGSYWVILGFTGFLLGLTKFYSILLGFFLGLPYLARLY